MSCKIDKETQIRIEDSLNSMFDSIDFEPSTAPINVLEIAQKLGFVVGNATLTNDDDGFIIVDEGKVEILGINADKVIGVNANRQAEWKRFIIAHEIGHYILDFKDKNLKGLYANRYHERGHSVEENEIDFFAANLLMPRKIFTDTYNELSGTTLENNVIVQMLADYFNVTKLMVTRRIDELELA